MKADSPTISAEETKARERMRNAIHLQEIEGNPFTLEDFELLDMFEREGWSTEQCRAYILNRIKRT